MKKWDDNGPDDSLTQGQFTAYLQTAVRHSRIAYYRKKEAERRNELTVDQDEFINEICDEPDMLMELPILDQIENPYLQRLLKNAKPLDRYVLYAKAIESRSFSEIAKALGKKYHAISAQYYRTIKKFKKEIIKGNSNAF